MRVLLIKKDKINGNIYELSKKESNYLTNVLRLKNGDSFKAKDEKENIYNALLNGNYLTLSENNDDVLFLDAMPSFKGHFQRIHLYQSILKGKKNERVLRDSQEAGVEKLTFISTEFTSADEITEHEASRLEAIRREAVQQSGAKVMDIGAVMKFDDAIEEADGIILILHQSPRVMTKSIKEALQDVKKEDAPLLARIYFLFFVSGMMSTVLGVILPLLGDEYGLSQTALQDTITGMCFRFMSWSAVLSAVSRTRCLSAVLQAETGMIWACSAL